MKKVWALVLSLAMILTLASFPTFATESEKLDLAAIATITAKSDGGQPVARMVDGDLTTTWEDQWGGDSVATTVTATFQLNGLYSIDKIVVYAGGGTGTAPKDIKVEVSADGETYTEVAYENYEETQVATEINTNYKWGGVTSTFDSLTATGVNYVRLTMTRNNYRLALREVEMYGAFESALPSPVKIINATTTLTQDASQADCTLEKSYDGNMGTAFLSGSSSGYVTFELDKWYDLSTFNISFGLDSWTTTDMSPKKFNVSVSSDGVDFTQAYTYSADAGLGGKVHTLSAQAFDTDVAKNVKFIRIELVEKADWEFGLTEFSAIGTALNVTSVDYTVNYVDIRGNSIAAAKNSSALSGATVSESPISITGYTPVGIGADQTLSISDNAEENVLTFVYYNSAADKATVASAESSFAAYGESTIDKSYDGKDSTYFAHEWMSPATKDRRIVWELDQEYDLNSIAFVWPSLWGGQNSAAQIYRVAVSSDGLVWHTVERVNDTTDVTGQNVMRHDAYAVSAKNVKYVRILIDQVGCGYMALGEAKFFGTPSATATGTRINPVNVSTSATTDTPVNDTITNAYENMFDGDKDTAWWSTAWAYGSLNDGSDLSLTFTLANITSLDTVRFGITGTEESWGGQQGSLTAFDLYVSSNGADYTKVYSYNGDMLFDRTRSGSNSDGIVIDEFTGDVSAVKYIKLTMTYGSRTAINEFYVTGTENTSGLSSKGAQMRLDNGTVTAGLRFATTIDKATFGIGESYSYADNNGVTFGMYLLPTDKLGEYNTLLDYINANNTLGDAVKVEGINVYSQDANALTYTAVLTQIPTTGYNRDVVALPYVISNGNTVYGTEMTRSYYSVAKAMRTSGAELTEDQIAALDAIIDAVENA